MQVRTSTGELVTFNDNQPRWITATQIARRRLGLEATNVLYSVESVMIDGTNVVNRYQQRYLAQANTWEKFNYCYIQRLLTPMMHSSDFL